MVALNQVFADGADALVRAVVRQATTAISSSIATTPTSGPNSSLDPTSFVSTPPSTTPSLSSLVAPSTTSALFTPTLTPTPSGDAQQNQQGNNSPLLFFVALGFGVVFTNLWIIVGVKYCFRYNARNRQLRGLDENGEPINMDNMPQRPHRRRREKKLMTMDEVNEKFPMTKYKTWVSSRAREGLPTAGGVSVHPSRANSVRSVQGIVPELSSKERDSVDGRPQTAAAGAQAEDKPVGQTSTSPDNDNGATTTSPAAANTTTANGTALTSTQTIASIDPKDHDRHGSDDEDDDEHINAALPPEMLEAPGDACAICIDTLEDDDDIRGLTCGHAFHAVCLDPWLTNRRACCPLCKADYYTPKPRPPPTEGETTTTVTGAADPARNNSRMNMPRNPTRSFNPWSRRNGTSTTTPAVGGSGRSRGAARAAAPQPGPDRAIREGYFQRFERERTGRSQVATTAEQTNQEGLMTRLGRGMPRFTMPRFGRNGGEPASQAPVVTAASMTGPEQTTPSQLEAGVRPVGAAAVN